MTKEKKLSDCKAMNLIQSILSGHSWTPDTLDEIADIVIRTGREIKDCYTNYTLED